MKTKLSEEASVSRRNRSLQLFSLLIPGMVLLFLFYYIPLYGIVISFQDFTPYLGVRKSKFVGFANFINFLTDFKFWEVMKNTLILNFLDLAFGFTAPILFALLVNEIQVRRFKVVVQTISYLPNFLSWIVVGGLFYQVLAPTRGGLVNRFLVDILGMREPMQFLTDVGLFRGILVFADIWKNMGWGAILYFAALAGIDTSLYEAAYIDGAGRLKQTWYVTLPGIAPFISLMLLLKISSIFTIGFDRLFVLQNPLVLSVADVISTYIYRVGLVNSQFSLTTAIGIVQSVLGFTLLITSNRVSKRLTGMGLY